MCLKLVDYDINYLNKSRYWLKDPVIKKSIGAVDVSKQDQLNWFNNLENNPSYLIWGIQYESLRVGACGLKNVTQHSAEYWGYIGEKEFWGKGIGSKVLVHLISKARSLNLEYLWLKVYDTNQRALSLYNKKGFQMVSKGSGNLLIMKLIL
jgi:RimJ/RimL family protein N-acetyltransferase